MRRRLLVLLTLTLVVPPTRASAILPPTSNSDLAKQAQGIVKGVIENVAQDGPPLTTIAHEPGWAGPAPDQQAQIVTIKITEVLRWPTNQPKPRLGTRRKIIKPIGPYSLAAGKATVVAMLDLCGAKPTIVGRYGSVGVDESAIRAEMATTAASPCPKRA